MKGEFRKGDMLVVIGTKDVLLVNRVKKCTYSLVPVNCGKTPLCVHLQQAGCGEFLREGWKKKEEVR